MYGKFIKDLKELTLKKEIKISSVQKNKILRINVVLGYELMGNICSLCKKYDYNNMVFGSNALLPSDFNLDGAIPECIFKTIKNANTVIIVDRTEENPVMTNIINRMVYKRKINEDYIKDNILFIDYRLVNIIK